MHLALWIRRFGSQVMSLGGMDIYIYSSCSSVQTAIKALCIQQKLLQAIFKSIFKFSFPFT